MGKLGDIAGSKEEVDECRIIYQKDERLTRATLDYELREVISKREVKAKNSIMILMK